MSATTNPEQRRWFAGLLAAGLFAAVVLVGTVARTPSASAAQPSVGLGTAISWAVLAGTTVTNTGPSVISGDLGVSPGTAITGFPPGTVINGAQHAGDATALQAQADLTTAYNDAAGRTPASVVSTDLGGQTLAPGVYQAASSLGLTGTVTLDAQNDPDAVFIFQAGSTLITASSSTVSLIGQAQPCNVFWQVGSSATLGTDTTFVGTVMALTSASVQTGASVAGRVLARNGQVSLDTNTITRPPACTAAAPTTTTTAAPTTISAPPATTTISAPPATTTTQPSGSTPTTVPPGVTTTTTTTGPRPPDSIDTGPVPPGPTAPIPSTGSPIGATATLGVLALLLGLTALRLGRAEPTP